MLKVTALIFMTFFIASCGANKSVSAVKLKLFQSSIVSGSNTDGGILLVGRSEDGLNSFRTSVAATADSISLTLVKGRWEFAAISWVNSSGPMTGDNRCAFTGYVDLKDAEASVSLNLSQTRCLTDFDGKQFSATAFQTTAGRFLDFFPVMCINQAPGGTGCVSTENSTNILAYKVVYKSELKGSVTGDVAALSSDCLTILGGTRVKIPVTDDINGSPFNVTTMFYKNVTCNGDPALTYDFKDGILANQIAEWNEVTPINNYYSYFYLNPGVQFNAQAVNPTGFTLSGLVLDSVPTFASNIITYNLGSYTSSVSDVCFSLTSTCPASSWMPLSSTATGNYALGGAATDGNYSLYIFYRTFAGVVSTTPFVQPLRIDQTAPAAPIVTIATFSAVTGVSIAWSSIDNSSFLKYKVEVCGDIACTVIKKSVDVTSFSTKNLTLSVSEFGNTITAGQNLYVRITAIDQFARQGVSTTSTWVSTI